MKNAFHLTISVTTVVTMLALGVFGGRALGTSCNDVANCKSYWCFFIEDDGTECFSFINGFAFEDVGNAEELGLVYDSNYGTNTYIEASDCDKSCRGSGSDIYVSETCDIEPDAFSATIIGTRCVAP